MKSLFDLLDVQSPELRSGTSAIEDGFPFVAVSTIAEAESWRKEIYRPIYHLHKWWAQRLGSVFRAIILAAALPENGPVLDLFYQKNDLGGLVIFDPFMGSGTTIGEAVKLGCTAIGRDINPVAYNIVRAALSAVRVQDAKRVFKDLESTVGERIRKLYTLRDGSQVLYYFWVKQIGCPTCGKPVDMFSSYIFARHAYPSRKPEAQCVCPECSGIFTCRYDSPVETCPHCLHKFCPQAGPARRATAICPHCGDEFYIAQAARAAGTPPSHRLYAKMVLRSDGEKEYRRIDQADLASYSEASGTLRVETPLIPRTAIEPGNNTNQVLSYGYTTWDQFFNARQLLALTWLGRAIGTIPDSDMRLLFTVLFSGTLEFNNMFCSFKGEGTGAVRHMFSHHILKPERQPIEANVWGTARSSGAFSTLFRSRLLRAWEYRENPFEIAVTKIGSRVRGEKRYGCNQPIADNLYLAQTAQDIRARSVYLSCGDSASTDLQDGSVDLVVTDPPFFDNVHYSELADFFYVWQAALLGQNQTARVTTRDKREVQDQDAEAFSHKLAAVFSECHRVLKDDGLLVFTYHHSREDGWLSIARAVTAAGFRFVSAQPVKAEMSIAVPIRQAKHPIQLDMILVCRKCERDGRAYQSVEEAFTTSLTLATSQIEALCEKGWHLSQGDLRIILLSHLLVTLSAQRTEGQLLADFNKGASRLQAEIQKLSAVLGKRFRGITPAAGPKAM